MGKVQSHKKHYSKNLIPPLRGFQFLLTKYFYSNNIPSGLKA
jgi:hypothetical protein